VVQHGTAVPPSRQVAASLRERISSGALAPGSKLPSIVNLSAEYRTSTGTIQKALAILRTEGLIVSVPNYGTFVAER
jgi:DNA-binding GntR family transcriptional regulator